MTKYSSQLRSSPSLHTHSLRSITPPLALVLLPLSPTQSLPSPVGCLASSFLAFDNRPLVWDSTFGWIYSQRNATFLENYISKFFSLRISILIYTVLFTILAYNYNNS